MYSTLTYNIYVALGVPEIYTQITLLAAGACLFEEAARRGVR